LTHTKSGVDLEIRGISKRFPGVQALQDVSLTLREREVHAIIGENGAGKSTLMNILCGMVQADEGEILRTGVPVHISSPIVAQKYGIGMVPQELNLVPDFTVKENILLGMEPRKLGGLLIDKRKLASIAERTLALLEETIELTAKASHLSAAQQQIVQIARTLAFGAKIIIFDEPTASLTLTETERLFRNIRDIRAKGVSIFYISHRLEEILEISDRISVLRDGAKVAELDASSTTRQEMIRAMVGREITSSTVARTYNKSLSKVVLKVENLSRGKEFSGISFELHEGEILGFAGLIGAGRTELMKCIFGDVPPSSGTLTIDGRLCVHHHPSAAVANRLAYVPEERRKLGLFPTMSVRENMTLPILRRLTRFLWIDRRRESKVAHDYLRRLDIKAGDIRQSVRNLSGGNQQKVILARWLLSGARILILDEPTRGIDVNAKDEIHRQLKELANQGLAIIFISSEHQEVIDVADRIIVMHEGRSKGELLAAGAKQETIMKLALA
jgi:ribose transport system ATP-binding protein